MVKTKKNKKISRSQASAVASESDSIYFLKLVLYLILGSQWLRITKGSLTVPIPIGLIVGLLLARYDRLSFDRKIAYAILLVTMFIGFWLPMGIEFKL